MHDTTRRVLIGGNVEKIQCDGCGISELMDLPAKKQTISKVTLLIVKDPRPNFPEGTEKYEADLCPNCQGTVLHTYFKIQAKGTLTLPAFIEPKRMLEDAPVPLASRGVGRH